MTALKVWSDVVDDGLGEKPWDPEDILRPRSEAEFEPEAIGYLTTPVDIIRWIDDVFDNLNVDHLRVLRSPKS